MNVVDAIAHAMKAEGIDMLFAYPVNPLIEAAAKLDIRTDHRAPGTDWPTHG